MTQEHAEKSGMEVVGCPICESQQDLRELYPARIVDAEFNFSARKQPTRQHFRIARCERCELLISSPRIELAHVKSLYEEAAYIHEGQLENMAADYAKHVLRLVETSGMRLSEGSLLEIGCADGFFLRKARALGFGRIVGLEPGREATQRAGDLEGIEVVRGFFPEALRGREPFDVICFFQVLDHIGEPVEFLRGVRAALRDGGRMIAIHHNISSLFARLLGESCPMVDVEHLFLYNPRSMRRMLEKCGFREIQIRPLWNRYTLDYASKMFPVNHPLKLPLQFVQRLLPWLQVRVPAGNMLVTAVK